MRTAERSGTPAGSTEPRATRLARRVQPDALSAYTGSTDRVSVHSSASSCAPRPETRAAAVIISKKPAGARLTLFGRARHAYSTDVHSPTMPYGGPPAASLGKRATSSMAFRTCGPEVGAKHSGVSAGFAADMIVRDAPSHACGGCLGVAPSRAVCTPRYGTYLGSTCRPPRAQTRGFPAKVG